MVRCAAMSPSKKSKSMSQQHKNALAEGRTQGRAVRNYLDAIEAHKPKRGRRRTPDSISKRLATIKDELDTADRVRTVELIQERMNLEAELDKLNNKVDLGELEAAFIDEAAAYSERKGISYAAWREAGVPAAILKAAGIRRGQ